VYGGLWFFLKKISFTDLAYSQGEHDQLSRSRFSTCSQGELHPFPLMKKGENDFEDLGVAIKSKGGDRWHYELGLALWHRCCP